MTPSITVDRAADAAYILLFRAEVATTESVTDAVLVDLDDMRVVVGIEVLHLDADIPFAQLAARYHVHSDVLDLVRAIRPTVGGFVASLTSGADGTSVGGRITEPV